MRKKIVLTVIAGLALMLAGVNAGLAKGSEKHSTNNRTQIKDSSSHESGHHDSINSGRDFGQHVKEMNDNFSGDHNPGKHHKGYSGLKD
ncbi:hypothetical protein [Desulfopila aestuarii]|uniref:Uncharacterized protein n=1 Tax=Desulfopila aestuarii DSM 18488 TaxID=1121416 RepID=A0A1M7YGP0_9BACT|nr:hypothetical protein [Desulfopila aestuarii]SHO51763.1 hypothetical protein SAMN02745220_04215 [Desulfopila aestuarii DSM 18488]